MRLQLNLLYDSLILLSFLMSLKVKLVQMCNWLLTITNSVPVVSLFWFE